MQNQERQVTGPAHGYIFYERGRFANLSISLVEFMARVRVGSNGWPVMACLCTKTHADGSFGAYSREGIANRCGMTPAQVSRGLADLRERLVIEPVERVNSKGELVSDRSNFGHVARYRFTEEAWAYVKCDVKGSVAGEDD